MATDTPVADAAPKLIERLKPLPVELTRAEARFLTQFLNEYDLFDREQMELADDIIGKLEVASWDDRRWEGVRSAVTFDI